MALCVVTVEKIVVNISDRSDVKPFSKLHDSTFFLSTETQRSKEVTVLGYVLKRIFFENKRQLKGI
jgi:hypothetical protein